MELFKKNDLTEKLIIVSCYLVEKIYEYNKSKKKYAEKILFNVNRLNKLLYFVQIENMRRIGKPMFMDDFYAWSKGPAIEHMYRRLITFTIPEELELHCIEVLKTLKERISSMPLELTWEEKDVIDYVFEKTKTMDMEELAEISRQEGTPWHHNYNPDDINHLQIISKTDIFDYYVGNEKSKQITKKLF